MLTKTIRLARRNVLALVALFVALGGVSYAATTLPADSVGTEQVRDGSLLARDFADHQSVQEATTVARAGTVTGSPNTQTRIITFHSIPAGSYLVLAKTNIVHNSQGGDVCILNNTLINPVASPQILDSSYPFSGASGTAANSGISVNLQATLSTSRSSDVSIDCSFGSGFSASGSKITLVPLREQITAPATN
jgi:hypothetical protein